MAGEEDGTGPPHRVDQPRHGVQHRAETRHPHGDQDRVGGGADERDGEGMLAADALAQYE